MGALLCFGGKIYLSVDYGHWGEITRLQLWGVFWLIRSRLWSFDATPLVGNVFSVGFETLGFSVDFIDTPKSTEWPLVWEPKNLGNRYRHDESDHAYPH